MYNRLSAKAGNGVILGTTGAGKSFAAKMEMLQVLLNTTDEIFVIDAEDEYTTLAQMLKGAVIRLAPGSGIYLNPLDMDLDYADSDDPITLKSSFISSSVRLLQAANTRFPRSCALSLTAVSRMYIWVTWKSCAGRVNPMTTRSFQR